MPKVRVDSLDEAAMAVDRKKTAVAAALNIETIEMIRRVDVPRPHGDILEYHMTLVTGAVVNLGPAKDVISFAKVRAAFADAISHVIPGKEAKNWDIVAQWILDIEVAQRRTDDGEAPGS